MAIEQLLAVVPAPKEPLEAGSLSEWDAVCERLGIRLPDDYRDLGIHYGSGAFGDCSIQVFNPFSEYYFTLLERELDSLRGLKKAECLCAPHDVFPEKPGRLPWGCDDNGSVMTWLTAGEPRSWPLVLFPIHAGYSERLDMSLTTFLANAISNKLSCSLWGPFPGEPTFPP